MKKRLLALLLVLTLSLGLIGCNSKPVDSPPVGDNEKTDDVGEIKEDVIATEITEPTEVVFWHAMSGSNEEALVNLANNFMDENPNIKINLQFQGNYRELFDKLMAAAKAINYLL